MSTVLVSSIYNDKVLSSQNVNELISNFKKESRKYSERVTPEKYDYIVTNITLPEVIRDLENEMPLLGHTFRKYSDTTKEKANIKQDLVSTFEELLEERIRHCLFMEGVSGELSKGTFFERFDPKWSGGRLERDVYHLINKIGYGREGIVAKFLETMTVKDSSEFLNEILKMNQHHESPHRFIILHENLDYTEDKAKFEHVIKPSKTIDFGKTIENFEELGYKITEAEYPLRIQHSKRKLRNLFYKFLKD